jgi:hypothetical protein
MERPSSLPMQISTRYLQFGQSAGIGKISSLLKTPEALHHWGGSIVNFFLKERFETVN